LKITKTLAPLLAVTAVYAFSNDAAASAKTKHMPVAATAASNDTKSARETTRAETKHLADATTAASDSTSTRSNPSTDMPDWTVVELASTINPRVLTGSDGVTNLVYELVVTNFGLNNVPLKSFQVYGDTTTEKPLLTLDSKGIAGVLQSSAKPKIGSNLAPGAVAILFVNIELGIDGKAPDKLIQKLTYEYKDKKKVEDKTTTYETTVDKTRPIIVGAPLSGKGWLATGGYVNSGHRRSLFPLNNTLKCAQRFAIDWLRLDDQNRIVSGDKKLVESFSGYGKPVFAVADATVYGVVDKFENQPPYKASGSMEHPGGNTITLKISDNAYGFYAHLKPGSIKVKEGDRVKKGQMIASLGNVGNTDGPHLHFHITESPDVLGSNGIPYAFEQFDLSGETAEAEFMKNFYSGGILKIDKATQPGTHKNQLPKEGNVVSFPELAN